MRTPEYIKAMTEICHRSQELHILRTNLHGILRKVLGIAAIGTRFEAALPSASFSIR